MYLHDTMLNVRQSECFYLNDKCSTSMSGRKT